MPKVIQGELNAANQTFAVVVSRFNDLITRRLVDGAVDLIVRLGGQSDRIDVVWVPGAFEIPLTIVLDIQRNLCGHSRFRWISL